MELRTWEIEHFEFIQEQLDAGYTYEVIAELLNEEFGLEKTGNSVRKFVARAKDSGIDKSSVAKKVLQSRKSAINKSKISAENRLLSDYLNKQGDFLQMFSQIMKNTKLNIYKSPEIKKAPKINRAIFMHLSDMHFQANIDIEEMGGINAYTSIEESRRLAFFTKEVANYKRHHREDTELVIAINGDIIQGIIHDIESTPAITTQVSAAIHLLTQSISYLATQFKKVRVVCTTGNHCRVMHKSNKGRQTREKWDSFATIIYVGLKYALSSISHISVEIPIAPYAYIDILGHKFLITHSDTILNVGYPGKSINVENAKNKINALKEGIGHIDVVVVGHVHVDTKQLLPNGVTLLTNGSMSGTDEFALSIGITNNNPTQQVFEITENHKVGDLRSVELLGADKDSSLDKIIKPFKGKF
jgi:predicted MPP superfamily phosphohydrolase